MKKLIAKILGVLMVATMCFLLAGAVFADEQPAEATGLEFGVTELDFGEIAEGGHSFTKELAITNKGEEAATVDLSVSSYSDDELANNWKAAEDWIVFVDAKNHFEIAPGETVTAGVRLVVPDTVEGGTYYARVLAKSNKGENLLNVMADVTTEGFSRSGGVLNNSVSPVVILTTNNKGICDAVKAEVKNTGSARFNVSYSLVEENAFGLSDERTVDSGEYLVAQMSSKKLGSEECKAEKKGFVKVIQKIQYVNAEGKLATSTLERRILVLPVMALVIAGGVIALIIVLAIVIHVIKSRKKSAKKAAVNEI